MADVADRWHKRHPKDGEPRCREHGLVPTADHGRGLRWLARWRDDQSRQKKQAFRRKSAAEAHLADVRSKLQTGRYVDPAAGRVTLAEYAAQWRAGQLHRASTTALAERTLRLHVLPFLGDYQMSQVRGSHLRTWVRDREPVMAPASLRLAYSFLRSMFRQAATDRVIGVSPCVGVKLPPIEQPDLVIPTVEQVHTLADALHARFRAAVYLAAGCGLRVGEVFGLELPEVNFLGREMTVVRQLVTVTGRKGDESKGIPYRAWQQYLSPPKTKTSRRTVELPDVVSVALAEHLKHFPVKPVELEDRTDRRRPVRPAELLFTTESGRAVDSRRWAEAWGPAARAAGLPPRTGMHALRHFYATRLIESGASVKTVQLALGHAKASMTLDVYLGLWPEATDRTRTILDEALGSRDVPQMCPAEAGDR